MTRNIYVGNLSYSLRDPDLEGLFANYGPVESAKVIMDQETGRSKGFGFVEMRTVEAARAAIDALNGKDVDGRNMTVNEARPREDRRSSGFGSGRMR